jgi:hypothetical protein
MVGVIGIFGNTFTVLSLQQLIPKSKKTKEIYLSKVMIYSLEEACQSLCFGKLYIYFFLVYKVETSLAVKAVEYILN